MKPIRRLKTSGPRALRQSLITPAMSRQALARFKRFVYAGLRRLDAGKPTFMFVCVEEHPGTRRRRTNATAVGGPPWSSEM